MALVSPGVEVTVIDESQYIPSAVNTVPYFLIATAQNKISGSGVGVAAGTLESNANKTYLITSQRDLAATFGVPFFYQTSTGTAINGYELNEYGLLAAYSALGVSNRAYVQRVNINLTELTASLTRPVGEPNNGTFWLDTSTSVWGIQEWNQTTKTFTVKTPIVITNTAQVVDFANDNLTPLTSVGSIGDYAIVALTNIILGYYKNTNNVWVPVGSDDWKNSWPTVTGTNTPVSLTGGDNMFINDVLVTVPASPDNTVTGLAAVINGSSIPGISAGVSNGRLVIFADSEATNDGSTGISNQGVAAIDPGPVNGAALLALLGIVSNEYNAPQYLPSYSYQVPRWRTTDTNPSPTGSVWNNMSPANFGLSLQVKRYNTNLGTWITQSCPAYVSDAAANTALDPVGGGRNIPVGSTYVNFDAILDNQNLIPIFSFEILERASLGSTVVTGSTNEPGPFVNGNSFTIFGTAAGTENVTPVTVTINGTTAADFIAAVSAANIPNVSASINSAGAIVFTHSLGGVIGIRNVVGTPITQAGFTVATPFVRPNKFQTTVGGLLLTNWVTEPQFTYTSSNVAPDQDPVNGRLWYYSDPSVVDIMIQDNGQWKGYQNVTNDVRGFDLSETNANGPIVAATAPTTQNDLALSPLVYGDLWLDSSDLENYPKLYRWEPLEGVDQWVPIDISDQVTENGILFADARWAANGTTNPISDPFPSITGLLVSDYLDLDAPNSSLYPQGMLLFNTRRSGFNIKSYQNNYFNSNRYPDSTLPQQTSTWLTASGNKNDGSMYAGRQAQRQMVVAAMKAGIDTSVVAREEQVGYSLVAAPGYPELIPNLVALSNERNNTLFVIGDTPMRLPDNGTDIVEWATNNNGLGLDTADGLAATSQYLATFYPSCQTTDLSGNLVVQPPSHMMIRTILRSDAVSYPWLAPAGTRRGVVDNAVSIGYIDSATGEFQTVNNGRGIRDVLYENNINPITFIPGIGITNFGNKTTTSSTTALDRINVARLVAFLRARLEEIGKLYLFEPNDEITRNEITNTVNSLMIDLISKRAIYDYLVVCDLSNNTPGRIDRNELWVDIAIEPVKAIEFVYIPLRIKNTGEISGQSA
jgi:hypothetical protein